MTATTQSPKTATEKLLRIEDLKTYFYTEEGEIYEVIDPNFEDFVAMEFSQSTTPDMDQPEELLRTYDGPYLLTTPVNE